MTLHPLPPAAKPDGPFLPLLITVFTSIFQVFLLCLAGFVLARRGILDKKTIKHLNRLNIALFTPALIFSKVAFFLSPEKLKELWIIPIFFVLLTAVSFLVSFFLASISRVTRPQRNFALAAAMFMNSNSLPVALMQSLVTTLPMLKWGADDNIDAMVGRALTYLLLYSTLGLVLRWSVGWQLLTSKSGASDPENDAHPAEVDETTALVSPEFAPEDATPRPSFNGAAPQIQAARRSGSYSWLPKSPNQSRVRLTEAALTSTETIVPSAEEQSDSEEEAPKQHALPQHIRSASTITVGGATGGLRRTWRGIQHVWTALNGFMTAPLWAALASILVACVGPLQHAFKDHMHPVKGALANAGNCSIPTTLIVLGAYFYPKPPESAPPDGAAEKQGAGWHAAESNPGETRAVAIAVVSRMLITPLPLLPLVALCVKFKFQAVFNDPVFVVANVLVLGSPPALTLAQISQAASGDAFERLISRTIFWAYCIVTPFTAIAYTIIGLRLAEL
ncbi:auxin efflux carrier [Mycena latifolia]|nr:auxin efflux carrier [Mycena latifolia]